MVDSPVTPSPEALFRYVVVAAVRALELRGVPRTAAVREVAEQGHPFGPSVRKVAKRTIWRWLAAWDAGALVGLEPATRPAPGCRALSSELIAFLVAEKTGDPDASIPELIERAREGAVIHPEERVDRTTVWRMLVRRGVPTNHRRPPKGRDSRRWAYRERMQLVMVDFKQFRAGPTRARRAALYLIDDATRFGLGVWVTTIGERPADVLRGLAEVIRTYGLMSVLYWDLGSGFRADDIAAVLARLDIAPIFGTAGYPEARGKIERFNRSAQARILRALTRDDVDPSLPALQLRLRHDLTEVYNHRPHRALGGRTPHEAFFSSERSLRPAKSEDWLRQCFTLPVERTVSADHVIQYGGELWEAPRGLARARIDIHRRLLEGPDALYVQVDDRLVRLHRVDPHFNATSGRAEAPATDGTSAAQPPPTASMRRYQTDHPSMLSLDGGYVDRTEEETDDFHDD